MNKRGQIQTNIHYCVQTKGKTVSISLQVYADWQVLSPSISTCLSTLLQLSDMWTWTVLWKRNADKAVIAELSLGTEIEEDNRGGFHISLAANIAENQPHWRRLSTSVVTSICDWSVAINWLFHASAAASLVLIPSVLLVQQSGGAHQMTICATQLLCQTSSDNASVA